MPDVARLTGVSIRMLRDYIRRGLLHYSERRGTLTRYPRSEVLRLLGALRLKMRTKNTWAGIKQQVDALSEADLERWLAEQGLGPAIAAELGVVIPPSATMASLNAPSTIATDDGNHAWQRTELLPGLVLVVSATASVAVQRAAQRIIDEHVASSSLPSNPAELGTVLDLSAALALRR